MGVCTVLRVQHSSNEDYTEMHWPPALTDTCSASAAHIRTQPGCPVVCSAQASALCLVLRGSYTSLFINRSVLFQTVTCGQRVTPAQTSVIWQRPFSVR